MVTIKIVNLGLHSQTWKLLINPNISDLIYLGNLPQLVSVQPEAKHEETGSCRDGSTRAGCNKLKWWPSFPGNFIIFPYPTFHYLPCLGVLSISFLTISSITSHTLVPHHLSSILPSPPLVMFYNSHIKSRCIIPIFYPDPYVYLVLWSIKYI